jgi:hypothetical protein
VPEPAETSAAAGSAVASKAAEAARLRVAQDALIETLADAIIYARPPLDDELNVANRPRWAAYDALARWVLTPSARQCTRCAQSGNCRTIVERSCACARRKRRVKRY